MQFPIYSTLQTTNLGSAFLMLLLLRATVVLLLAVPIF